ncbi:hypothetical protein DMENIID0001_082500 [Sergentomyia squamirostris]
MRLDEVRKKNLVEDPAQNKRHALFLRVAAAAAVSQLQSGKLHEDIKWSELVSLSPSTSSTCPPQLT